MGHPQNGAMAEPNPEGRYPEGRYRVRPRVEREQSVPQQVLAARFHYRDEAESFAQALALRQQQGVVVEKLAPGGCWLQLSTVASRP
ncbi:hypothetical protein [Cyanobium sp. PCC 7001]|uniref:hypothetical protein n=1 Tax=Cyanobium sp. PCC 7001 TaxID=180281 RepID=UPI0005B95B18|nr:hypothetical protein [Cyanobium sp. PCC 7001]